MYFLFAWILCKMQDIHMDKEIDSATSGQTVPVFRWEWLLVWSIWGMNLFGRNVINHYQHTFPVRKGEKRNNPGNFVLSTLIWSSEPQEQNLVLDTISLVSSKLSRLVLWMSFFRFELLSPWAPGRVITPASPAGPPRLQGGGEQ